MLPLLQAWEPLKALIGTYGRSEHASYCGRRRSIWRGVFGGHETAVTSRIRSMGDYSFGSELREENDSVVENAPKVVMSRT